MVQAALKGSPTEYKFHVTGMDCASCAGKIERAVKKIVGASDVNIGLQSQTLTVKLDGAEKVTHVETVVKKIGIRIIAER